MEVYVVIEFSWPEFDIAAEFESVVGVYTDKESAEYAKASSSGLCEIHKTLLDPRT